MILDKCYLINIFLNPKITINLILIIKEILYLISRNIDFYSCENFIFILGNSLVQSIMINSDENIKNCKKSDLII